MLRKVFLAAFFVVLALGADNPPNTTTEAVAVFTNVILNFIDNTVHGDYSLGHWWAIAISWTVVVFAGLFACLKVSQLVNDLTTGGAYAGAGGLPIPVLRRFF